MTTDLTRGNPLKLILFFSIPLLIGNIFQQLYNMADTVIVGRTIGVGALAAVGATGTISFLALGFITGLTAGFSVVTAQRFGAGDEDGVRRSFAAAIVLSVLFTAVMTAVLVVTARPMLEFLDTPEDIIDDSHSYILTIFIGLFATTLFNLLSNMIRALGDSRTPLIFLAIACVTNIVLDFVLILTFHMGVAGAGIATVFSQFLSGVMCLVYMLKKFPILKISGKDFKSCTGILKSSLLLGLPMGLQSVIIAMGSMFVQLAVNRMGSGTVAGNTAAQKIDQIGVQPLMSFGTTMATYVAQNYGANNIPRIRQGVRQCTFIAVIWSLLYGAFMIFFGKNVAALVIGADQPAVVDISYIYLSTCCPLELILALLLIYRSSIQGLGKSLMPTLAGFVELAMRASIVLLLAAPFGYAGVAFAGPMAWFGACVMCMACYFHSMHKFKKTPPITAGTEVTA